MRQNLFKKRNAIYLCMYMLLCCTLVACDETETGPDNGKETAIQFDANIIARSVKTGFELNDTIGLFVTRWQDVNTPTNISSSGNYKDNVWFGLSGLPNDWVSENTVYFPADDSKVDLYAYYPYWLGQFIDSTFLDVVTPSDQSSYQRYRYADFMVASMKEVKKSSQKIQLNFYHYLSQMVFQLKPGAGFTAKDLLNARVKVINALTNAKYDFATDSLMSASQRGDIIPYNTWTLAGDTLSGAMAIVVPQEINPTTYIQVSLGSRVFTYKPQSFDMLRGSSYKFVITVNDSGLDVTPSVIPWKEASAVNDDPAEEVPRLDTIFGPFSQDSVIGKLYTEFEEFVLAPERSFKVSGIFVWKTFYADTATAVELADSVGNSYISITGSVSESNIQIIVNNFSDRSKDVVVKMPVDTLMGIPYKIVTEYDGNQLEISLNDKIVYQNTPQIDQAFLCRIGLGGATKKYLNRCAVSFKNLTVEN